MYTGARTSIPQGGIANVTGVPAAPKRTSMSHGSARLQTANRGAASSQFTAPIDSVGSPDRVTHDPVGLCQVAAESPKRAPASTSGSARVGRRGLPPCTKCGKLNQQSDDCWANIRCESCGEKGHPARRCGARQARCQQCRRRGHRTSDCPHVRGGDLYSPS